MSTYNTRRASAKRAPNRKGAGSSSTSGAAAAAAAAGHYGPAGAAVDAHHGPMALVDGHHGPMGASVDGPQEPREPEVAGHPGPRGGAVAGHHGSLGAGVRGPQEPRGPEVAGHPGSLGTMEAGHPAPLGVEVARLLGPPREATTDEEPPGLIDGFMDSLNMVYLKEEEKMAIELLGDGTTFERATDNLQRCSEIATNQTSSGSRDKPLAEGDGILLPRYWDKHAVHPGQNYTVMLLKTPPDENPVEMEKLVDLVPIPPGRQEVGFPSLENDPILFTDTLPPSVLRMKAPFLRRMQEARSLQTAMTSRSSSSSGSSSREGPTRQREDSEEQVPLYNKAARTGKDKCGLDGTKYGLTNDGSLVAIPAEAHVKVLAYWQLLRRIQDEERKGFLSLEGQGYQDPHWTRGLRAAVHQHSPETSSDEVRCMQVAKGLMSQLVWSDEAKRSRARQAHFERWNWRWLSVLDFLQIQDNGVESLTWVGGHGARHRRILAEAVEGFELFWVANFGALYDGCMQPLTSWLKGASIFLDFQLDAGFLRAAVENTICDFTDDFRYHAVSRHAPTRHFKDNPYATGLAVEVIKKSCEKLVATLLSGIDPFPHHQFYSEDGVASQIIGLDWNPNPSRGEAHKQPDKTYPTPPVTGSREEKLPMVAQPPLVASQPCPYYLLGELGIKKADGETYKCSISPCRSKGHVKPADMTQKQAEELFNAYQDKGRVQKVGLQATASAVASGLFGVA